MTERLSISDLRALARDCLTRAGASAGVAHAVAAEIVAAEATGDRRHGMEALLRDLRLMRYGRIDADAIALTSFPRPGLLQCDAQHGFAAAALAGATDTLADRANAQGIAMLRLDRASDPGAMIHITVTLAERGLSALAFGATGQGRVARPGHPVPAVLRRPPRDALELLLPTLRPHQPADSPLDGPVDHGAWIVAIAADPAGAAMLGAGIWDLAPPPPVASEVALSTELLEQIVTA